MDHAAANSVDTSSSTSGAAGGRPLAGVDVTARDAQRRALSELIGLLIDCARRETALFSEHRAAVDRADKDLDTARLRLDHASNQYRSDVEQKRSARQQEIDARYAEETNAARQLFEQRRKKAEAEYDAVSGELRKQLDQAVWLADSVNDGTQAKVKQDARKAKESHEADHQSLDELQNKTIEVAIRYGQPPPPVAQASTAPPPPGEGVSPGEHFVLLRDAARSRLKEFEVLALPNLLVGVLPVLLSVILLAGCGFAGRILLASRFPQEWQALAVGCSAGLALLLILGVVLKLLARGQVRRSLEPLLRALSDARAGADLKLRSTRDALNALAQKASQQREVEVNAARAKHDPALARAQQARDAVLSAARKESEVRQRHADERRDRQQAELAEWLAKAQADGQQRADRELRAAEELHAAQRQRIEAEHLAAQQALVQHWNDGLAAIQRSIEAPAREGASMLLEWSDAAISAWVPPRTFPSTVRFGKLLIDAHQLLQQLPADARFSLDLPDSFDLPAVLALPRQASLLIQADRTGRSTAIAALQMLMVRLLTSVPPGRVKFTILDPVGLGQNFAGFMHLADYDESLVGTRIWTDQEHIEQRLTDLTEHMETVIQKYLRNELQTIDEYNAQAGELAEPYRFLVVCDFPHGFQNESFRRLASIASTGARCGVYTLIMRDLRQAVPPGSGFDDVEAHSVNLVQDPDGRFTWRDEVFQQFPLTLDPPPDEQTLTRLMHTVGRLAKDANRVEVPFDAIAPRETEFWSQSGKSELRIPIGRMGATRQQSLRLGKGVAQHALIAGKTGSGKSTLLHAIITNAAMWYSPDEVELYLIDFKKGVEFKTYATHRLPHARAIAVESDREFGLSVLQRIDAEMTRRGEMFRNAGVQDIAGFRDETAGRRGEVPEETPGGADGSPARLAGAPPLPRILLIIDEFQEFFSEDDKLAQDAALLLDRLVRQGRAFGIHTLLGSQTIGGSSGLSRSTMGQMAVRIALQTSEADSQLILGDNNSAARLLSRPGEAIYNDAGGLVENNSPFQVAWLSDAQRDRYLQAVARRFAQSERPNFPAAIVFEGNAPADITRNQRLAGLLEGREAPSMPPRAYLGDPVAIKDPTHVAFRRQAGANVLLVGQHEETALAMVMSSLLSLAAHLPPAAARFVLLDGTPVDSPLHGRLAAAKKLLPHTVDVVDYRGVPDAMTALATELAARRDADDPGAPSVFVLILGLQRYRVLRKTEDAFSFSASGDDKPPAPDKQFADLLRDGPAVGMHVIAWADTAVSVDRTIERGLTREFDHRILMQMSANDSSLLIDSPAANKLGFHRAIAFSEEQGVMEKFRPYALPTGEWLEFVRNALASRFRPGSA